jgi:hypothetical protein
MRTDQFYLSFRMIAQKPKKEVDALFRVSYLNHFLLGIERIRSSVTRGEDAGV